MLQVIQGKTVYVVDFDTMPELPITGLTEGEEAYQEMLYRVSYPNGPLATLAKLTTREFTYAAALTHALQTDVITEPGKYGIHLKPGTLEYEIYTITE